MVHIRKHRMKKVSCNKILARYNKTHRHQVSKNKNIS